MPAATPFDADFVRRQFPAFVEPTLEGWAFFENAGGSYPCRQVVDRLDGYYRRTKVQPYGWYPASRAAGEAMDEAYVRLAALLGVGADEIHFGPSTSQNTYVLAQAFRGRWQPGDEIVVTNQDHEANSGAWRRLAASGIAVREWRVDPQTGRLDPAELERLLTARTRLVAFPHCSNVVAEINPAAEIVALAHAAGAHAVVDGVAYAPHGLPDVAAIGADAYLFSLYKTYGPHLGLMCLGRELLEWLPPQGHFFNAEAPRKRIVPAGPDHAQIAAAAGVADYLDAVHARHFGPEPDARVVGRNLHQLFRDREAALLAPLLDWLRGRDDVRVIGPCDPLRRAPTVSVLPLRRTIPEVLAELERSRIMAGGGHFYAVRPLEAMGVPLQPGVLRMSFLHYTLPSEVDQLIAALGRGLSSHGAASPGSPDALRS